MKDFKERKHNTSDGNFLKNHDVTKKHKVDVLACEKQLPIGCHGVKIILDATVVDKYLNDRKASKTVSPSHRKIILVQKIPRLNQDVFSENSNVMVKLEIPEDIHVNNNLSPEDSLVLDDVPVKQEDCISAPDSVDKNAVHDREFIEHLREDSQCQDRDNCTVELALKNELVESESCYEEGIIAQEFKDTLKNEELFVGEEFKHEELIPSYENVESINEETNEEIIEKNTRSSRKRKKCLDCDNCNHGLIKKSRVSSHNKLVSLKLPVKEPMPCSDKIKIPPKRKSSLGARDQKSNDDPPNKSSSSTAVAVVFTPIPKVKKPLIRDYHCDHCAYKGQRSHLINHFRNKHAHLFPNDSVRCSNCGEELPSIEAMRRHRSVCLLFLICKFCLVNVPSKIAMVNHMRSVHPEKICTEKYGKIVDEVCRYSMKGAIKTLKQTPTGRRYLEIRKYYLDKESELIKFYCPECDVTLGRTWRKSTTRCEICKSRLRFQCQKCKETRGNYPNMWRHLMSKNSGCSISESFVGEDHPSNVAHQVPTVSSNEPANFTTKCEVCDFKGSSTTQLYEHVLNVHVDMGIIQNGHHTCSKCGATFRAADVRLRRHKDLCGIGDRLPCRFCPVTYVRERLLNDHIASLHVDELDGRDAREFVEEAQDFRRMVKDVNVTRFNDKLRNRKVEYEKDYYHKGIESMLQPVCIECRARGPHDLEYCAKCQASLNFVCLKCDELFSKYSAAWIHATRTCENRSFTLNVGKTRKARGRVAASTTSEEPLYCEHCSFKNASKSILRNHIKYTHLKSQVVRGLLCCPKCYRSFGSAGYLRQHVLRCRVRFDYTCHFCDRTSMNFDVIEKHIAAKHAKLVRCKDTLDEILQLVIENKRARTSKTYNRFDSSGRIIRRTFSENIKLATFQCRNCCETLHKNIKRISETRTCTKCNGALRVHCKICHKVYSTWESIVNHFQLSDCGGMTVDEESGI